MQRMGSKPVMATSDYGILPHGVVARAQGAPITSMVGPLITQALLLATLPSSTTYLRHPSVAILTFAYRPPSICVKQLAHFLFLAIPWSRSFAVSMAHHHSVDLSLPQASALAPRWVHLLDIRLYLWL